MKMFPLKDIEFIKDYSNATVLKIIVELPLPTASEPKNEAKQQSQNRIFQEKEMECPQTSPFGGTPNKTCQR